MSEPTSAPIELRTTRAVGRGRTFAVYALLLAGGFFLLATSFAVWVDRVALNTNQFVNTSSQLLEDDAIRQVIADRAVDELYANVDVQAELKAQAPKDLKPLAAVAAAGLRQGAYTVVDRALRQPQLQNIWRASLRQSHQQLVDVLEGGGTAVSTNEGVVTLDLRQIILDTADRIGIRRAAEQRLPANVGQIEVLRSDQLHAAQSGFELLKALAWFLPLLTLAAFGLALWLGAGRRRSVVRDLGLVIAAVGIIGLIATHIVGNYVVDALATDTQTRAAGSDAWTIVTALLRSSFRWQIAVGVLFLAASWLASPRHTALLARCTLAPFLRQRAYPYGALAVLALVLLVTVPGAGFARTIFVVVLLALLALGIEVLRKQTLKEFPEESPGVAIAAARARLNAWMAAARAARPSASRASAGEPSVATQLRELAALRDAGALTEDEYTAAKARVLSGR
jgi:Short C-terminal domain